MFTKIYLTIAIVLRCYQKCSNFLWYFDSNSLSSVVSLFPKQKLCVFASVVPFQLAKIANWFLLNALFSGGLKIFYGSIRVSSLRQKRSSTEAIWLQALILL